LLHRLARTWSFACLSQLRGCSCRNWLQLKAAFPKVCTETLLSSWFPRHAQRQRPASAATAAPARSPTAREARKWSAALLKQVYEADPVCCPRCGAELKIIAFIKRHQTEVIEKILRHCGLWEEATARGSPAAQISVKG
jgi:hypothetical protein